MLFPSVVGSYVFPFLYPKAHCHILVANSPLSAHHARFGQAKQLNPEKLKSYTLRLVLFARDF